VREVAHGVVRVLEILANCAIALRLLKESAKPEALNCEPQNFMVAKSSGDSFFFPSLSVGRNFETRADSATVTCEPRNTFRPGIGPLNVTLFQGGVGYSSNHVSTTMSAGLAVV